MTHHQQGAVTFLCREFQLFTITYSKSKPGKLPWKCLYIFNINNEVFSTLLLQLVVLKQNITIPIRTILTQFYPLLVSKLIPITQQQTFLQGFPDGCAATSALSWLLLPPQSLSAPGASCQPAGREQGLLWGFLSTHCLCPARSCCCAQVSSSREGLLSNLNVHFNLGGEIGACQELPKLG